MNNNKNPKIGEVYQNIFKNGCASIFKYIVVSVDKGVYTVITLDDSDVLKWCSTYNIEYFDNLKCVGTCDKIDTNSYEVTK